MDTVLTSKIAHRKRWSCQRHHTVIFRKATYSRPWIW